MTKTIHLAVVSMFGSLFVLIFSGLFNFAVADYSVPVSHTHNSREHNHQLPKEGVYHRHGIGQFGKPIKQQNKVIYSNTTTIPNKPATTYKPPKPSTSYQNNSRVVNNTTSHTHAGRQHQHPLPNQGVYHRHGSNGQTGQRVVNTAGTVIYNDTRSFPKLDSKSNNTTSNDGTYRDRGGNNVNKNRQIKSNKKRWKYAQRNGLTQFTKGDTRCAFGQNDCNVCAVNVQQQFQKASAKQINWNRKRWNFTWPQPYPPQNVRPFDVFDGDPKYALGIPDTHVQGFVRTNSNLYPYAGSHSHKRKGGIFVIKQGANGEQFLSSLHQTTGRHPSGVQVIGRYLIYGEGTRLYFKDINSKSQDYDIRLTAPRAQFGGGLGIIKLADNNHLLITTGPGGQKAGTRFNRFYHLKSTNGRPSSLTYLNESTTKKPQQWPGILAFSENMSLITECGTGDVYSVHTTGDEQGLSAISGKGYWRLSKLVNNGKVLGLKAVNAFTTGQDMKRCNVRASATVNVNARNRLEFVCHGYAKDPDGSGFNVLGKSSRNRDKFYYNVGEVR